MSEISLSELARAKGVSRKAVYVAVRDGRITRNPNGKFHLEQTLEDWARNTHPFCGENHSKPQQEEERPFSHPLSNLHLAIFDTAAPLLALKLKTLGLEVEQIHQVLLWTSWIQMESLSTYLPVLQDKSWIPLGGILAVLGDETRFAGWLTECEEKFGGDDCD